MDKRFNPRPPRRGATSCSNIDRRIDFVSIHAPHAGERLLDKARFNAIQGVSIHAPHAGERLRKTISPPDGNCFNPRPPRRGATFTIGIDQSDSGVSIHAPHAGERPEKRAECHPHQIVSIHAPHAGERPPLAVALVGAALFQSTPPTQGSDVGCEACDRRLGVSIHAPHAGERQVSARIESCVVRFNPRPPRRGATRQQSTG